jgi:dolichol-phosphate mannosyltransferase
VVLPVYNEAGSKACSTTSARPWRRHIPYQVILVDDAARTPRQIVQVVQREHRSDDHHGQSWSNTSERVDRRRWGAGDRDIIITMDADDTHARVILHGRMISEGRRRHRLSISRGSRCVGVPPPDILSHGASWLFRATFPIRGVRDYTCGYRAYRARVVKDAFARYGEEFLDQSGFQCTVDILLKLRRMHLIFGEVPFILRYDYKEGGSKMDVSRTVGDTLSLMWKRRFGP